MRFNSVLNVDFPKWAQVKMERENNQKEFKNQDEEQPKYGAGSEYGREAREEARRKKYGIVTRKYRPEDQPWILKVGGKTGKKFKGIREGGVAENAAYYVFTHAADGGIEAFPLCEWYNFQPNQRYKALSAEEAEQEFGRRNKVMNFFSLMMKKRLKNEEDGEGDDGDEGSTKKGGKKNAKDFKISEMDDWVDSEDDESSSGGEDDEEKKIKKEKKKKNATKQKTTKKKKGSDDSAVEESDDGDEEGRELDYISDSSESESDHDAKAVKEMKGVAEETALRRLLTSDEDEDEEENEDKQKADEKKKGEEAGNGGGADKKRKRTKPTKEDKQEKKVSDISSDSSSDSSDSDVDVKNKTQPNSGASSRCATPTRDSDKKSSDSPLTKKAKMDVPPPAPIPYGDCGITEEAVRRYLTRKPMTATELLQKFKGRKTGLSSDQLVNVMTQILKRINPVKQTIKNKMYFSIKPTPN
ncbi:hypothetical protein AAG570_004665 [Ranatra chinensis]|uniref:Transcription initiation factor IIF subunit alpha n=1 Tax=Ranatra chinensis TaxID=642074 RepID=A0ABD0Y1H6_9HEMI